MLNEKENSAAAIDGQTKTTGNDSLECLWQASKGTGRVSVYIAMEQDKNIFRDSFYKTV